FLELGRTRDALALSLRAVEIDKLSPNHWTGLVRAYVANGMFAEAQALREKLYNDWPDTSAVVETRFANAMFSRDPAEALAVMQQLPPDVLKSPFNQAWMKFLRARQSKRKADMDAALQVIDGMARANVGAMGAAFIAHSAAGQPEGAFD